MKAAVYGAGVNAQRFLGELKKRYEIPFLLDRSPEKQGSELEGIPVLAPTEERVNTCPVILSLKDAESGHQTLKELGCKQDIYFIAEFAAGFGVFPYQYELSLETMHKQGVMFSCSVSDFSQVQLRETRMPYRPGKPRYFNITSSYGFELTGGPSACLRNLWLANEEYQLIDNFYTLCPSTAYIPRGAPICDPTGYQFTEAPPALFDFMNRHPDLKGTKETVTLYGNLKSLWNFLEKVDSRFHLQEDDVFLFQDPFFLQVFLCRFPNLKKVATAYHVQGTIASESARRAPELHAVYDAMQEELLERSKHWIFPSKGAADGLLQTGTERMRQAAQSCRFHTAYNGYEINEHLSPDPEFAAQLENLPGADVLLVSATYLYRNKGVERIPKVLAEFKRRTGLSIHWILVGSGEMESEVESNIHQYLQEGEYTWFKRRFKNQDNIFALFSKADFYIMMHYVSVFDLSTLQAMSYGCVPFLSNVGGNLELCGFENGILADMESGEIGLSDFMTDGAWAPKRLVEKKEQNRRLLVERFNNRSFLEGYLNVLKQL